MATFNFFEKELLLDEFCKFYRVDKNDVKKLFLASAFKLDPALDFIKNTDIHIDSLNIMNEKIACKHITTLNNNLDFLKKYGLCSLNDMLTLDTPLKRFLEEHNIKINISEKELIYGDKTLHLCKRDEDCIACYYGGCRFNRTNYDGNVNIEYRDNQCEYRKAIRLLVSKLYKHKGEIEVHLAGTEKDIHEYSSVKECPEIMVTIEDLINELFEDKVTLCFDWVKKQNGRYYCLSFDVNIGDFENIAYKPFMDEEFYQPYFKYCENRINSLKDATPNFFANIYIITKTINIVMNIESTFHGGLFSNIRIPFADMRVKEFYL